MTSKSFQHWRLHTYTLSEESYFTNLLTFSTNIRPGAKAGIIAKLVGLALNSKYPTLGAIHLLKLWFPNGKLV